MAFNDTMNKMQTLLEQVSLDLDKVHKGNSAAAQRVRVGTIHLAKIAKKFRKESVAAEKGGRLKRRKTVKKNLKKRKLI
jgi:hypothetical protein